MILSGFALFVLAGYAYWVRPTSQLSAVSPSSGKTNIRFSKKQTGASYTPNLDIRSVSQFTSYQKLNQPLYLKGYVSVPNAAILQPIYEGVSKRVLSWGAGTIRQNEAMGMYGNYAIADHNMYDFPYDSHFSGLQIVSVKNQPAYLYDGLNNRLFIYKLADSYIVPAKTSMQYTTETAFSNFGISKNGSITQNQSDQESSQRLTLYTCVIDPAKNWLYTSGERIIAVGVLVANVPETGMTNYEKSLFPSVFTKVMGTKTSHQYTKSRKVIKSSLKPGQKIAKANQPSFINNLAHMLPVKGEDGIFIWSALSGLLIISGIVVFKKF